MCIHHELLRSFSDLIKFEGSQGMRTTKTNSEASSNSKTKFTHSSRHLLNIYHEQSSVLARGKQGEEWPSKVISFCYNKFSFSLNFSCLLLKIPPIIS